MSINHATALEKSFVMTMVELLLLQIGVVASVRQWLLARQNPMSGMHWCSCNVFQIQKGLEGTYCKYCLITSCSGSLLDITNSFQITSLYSAFLIKIVDTNQETVTQQVNSFRSYFFLKSHKGEKIGIGGLYKPKAGS